MTHCPWLSINRAGFYSLNFFWALLLGSPKGTSRVVWIVFCWLRNRVPLSPWAEVTVPTLLWAPFSESLSHPIPQEQPLCWWGAQCAALLPWNSNILGDFAPLIQPKDKWALPPCYSTRILFILDYFCGWHLHCWSLLFAHSTLSAAKAFVCAVDLNVSSF